MSTPAYIAWQKTLPGDLAILFYAHNTNKNQTEKVAGFKIDNQTKINTLINSNVARLRIHIGVDENYNLDAIPDDNPAIRFDLEALDNNGVSITTLGFDYDSAPKFLQAGAYGSKSGTDEIPPAGAILFARAWLETPNDMIGDCFEGSTAKNLVQRVRYYTFQQEETIEIISRLNDHPNDAVIYLYLGASIPVSGHPFGFRPVLEISSVSGTGNSSFFDFSTPCPPVCD